MDIFNDMIVDPKIFVADVVIEEYSMIGAKKTGSLLFKFEKTPLLLLNGTVPDKKYEYSLCLRLMEKPPRKERKRNGSISRYRVHSVKNKKFLSKINYNYTYND